MLTQERLKELVHYDPASGQFTRAVTTSPRAKAGDKCGDLDGKGYLRLRVDRVRYAAHRLAWFYMTGDWPPNEVDHVNRNRADNKWSNLRLADTFTNKRNTPAYRNNKTGLKGVSWHACSRKWRSRIRVDGKEMGLGLYATPQEAHAAYESAAKSLFGEFARAV